MTELQIQKDLSGKVQGFKFTDSKPKKSRLYPENKETGLFRYEGEDKH